MEDKPKPHVYQRDGVWHVRHGQRVVPCATRVEALHQAMVMVQTPLCCYWECAYPQVKGDRYYLGLCSRHARAAARVLHVPVERLVAA